MSSDRPHLPDPERAAELGRRLALVTGSAGIGYWSVEREQERATWSQELRRIHGLPDGEAVPSFADWMRHFVHPDDRNAVYRALHQWQETGNQRLSFRIVARDGSVREVLSHAIFEDTGGGSLLFGAVIDLTAMRAAERALRQAESRAALAARAVGMGTWEQDLQAGQAHWDAQMWLLRGRAAAEQAPDREGRLAMLHPDDRAAMRRIAEIAAAQAYEFRVVWPDGQVRWIASRSTTVHDEDGRALCRIGVNWDITASRAAEAALRERELALRESESRSRMLSRMSHELRTPLNAILGFAQLLKSDDEGADDAAARRRRMCVEQIEAAGDHLLSLVDKVLDLTRSAAAPATDGASLPAAAAPADGAALRTVLYIEDNAVNTMIVAELVARRGDLRFESATSGTDGVTRAVELQPALILLDMQLPDIDGPEVYRRLRADPQTAGIPCVALSANALPDDIGAARAAGMADYLTKPLDFGVFDRALGALLGPAPARPPAGA